MVAQNPVNADGLTPQQVIAVNALVQGRTLAEAAKAARVTSKTLWNWRTKPHFIAAVNRRLQDQTDTTGTQGVGLVADCLQVLETIMKSSTAADVDRIRAAKVIMDSANDYQERRELEVTIARLEQKLMILAGAATNTTVDRFHQLEAAEEEGDGDNNGHDDNDDDDKTAVTCKIVDV